MFWLLRAKTFVGFGEKLKYIKNIIGIYNLFITDPSYYTKLLLYYCIIYVLIKESLEKTMQTYEHQKLSCSSNLVIHAEKKVEYGGQH